MEDVHELVRGNAGVAAVSRDIVEKNGVRNGPFAVRPKHVPRQRNRAVERPGLRTNGAVRRTSRKRLRSVPSTPPIDSCATNSR